jgi:SLT domain-containing protein
LENVLLDWDALAGCDLNQGRKKLTAVEIQGWAEIEAQKQPWWLACRKCLTELHRLHGDGFPSAPKMADMTDFQKAHDHIVTSNWFSSLQAATNEILNAQNLATQIKTIEAEFRTDLNRGTWIRTFSGKEIYNQILNRIHGGQTSPTAEPAVDLAKSVGKWQLAQSAIPHEVDQLRRILKARFRLP